MVDPEAAEVVKRIFAMTIEGYGPYQIASKLKSEKVLIPSAYLAQHGEGVNKNKTFKDVYGWGSSTICNLLEKREYLGHTINFKTRKHFKDKKSHYVPEDEWTIFENTHEAIIDQQTFDLVQKIRGNVRRYPDGWGEAAPLTGLLYCADCGGKMYVHRTNNGKRISQYTCSQYSKVPVGKLCTTQHRINEDVVLSLVSEMLKAIAEYLKSEASEKYKENVIKMGIPEKFCIGVSTSTLRKFAKKLDKSNELAFELWNTHYHEARLLAVLIFDHKCLSYDQIDTLMSEVLSWDLCDHLCKNLIIKLDYYEDFIFNWIAADHIYKKRASFVLIAASTIHDKSMTKETLDIYLKLVYENSCYEHDHIKKAVSWALREIGKTDFEYAEKVLLTAYDLLASGNKVQIWIAKDVIKELETVVKVKERKRLITSNSKMGRER